MHSTPVTYRPRITLHGIDEVGDSGSGRGSISSPSPLARRGVLMLLPNSLAELKAAAKKAFGWKDDDEDDDDSESEGNDDVQMADGDNAADGGERKDGESVSHPANGVHKAATPRIIYRVYLQEGLSGYHLHPPKLSSWGGEVTSNSSLRSLIRDGDVLEVVRSIATKWDRIMEEEDTTHEAKATRRTSSGGEGDVRNGKRRRDSAASASTARSAAAASTAAARVAPVPAASLLRVEPDSPMPPLETAAGRRMNREDELAKASMQQQQQLQQLQRQSASAPPASSLMAQQQQEQLYMHLMQQHGQQALVQQQLAAAHASLPPSMPQPYYAEYEMQRMAAAERQRQLELQMQMQMQATQSAMAMTQAQQQQAMLAASQAGAVPATAVASTPITPARASAPMPETPATATTVTPTPATAAATSSSTSAPAPTTPATTSTSSSGATTTPVATPPSSSAVPAKLTLNILSFKFNDGTATAGESGQMTLSDGLTAGSTPNRLVSIVIKSSKPLQRVFHAFCSYMKLSAESHAFWTVSKENEGASLETLKANPKLFDTLLKGQQTPQSLKWEGAERYVLAKPIGT